jgi:NADH-quinone oxidoreductase subunit J
VGGFGDRPNVEALARVLFSDYVFAIEITSLLLTIAVVGAVVLAKRPTRGELADDDEELLA